MIYLHNTTENQSVYIPKSVKDMMSPEQDYTFSLFNTMDLSTEYEVTLPSVTMYELYYKLTFAFSEEMTEGTYEYKLTADDRVLSRGIAMVGAIADPVITYENDIEYTQYDGERED